MKRLSSTMVSSDTNIIKLKITIKVVKPGIHNFIRADIKRMTHTYQQSDNKIRKSHRLVFLLYTGWLLDFHGTISSAAHTT